VKQEAGRKRLITTGGYNALVLGKKEPALFFWLRDESLEESDNLPDPDVLAQEIIERPETLVEQFCKIVPRRRQFNPTAVC
jgi:hypothetical protein